MEFSVGEKINVEGTNYTVVGKIRYRNNVDNCQWIEYCLKGIQVNIERWLSYDETYFEYSITDLSANKNVNGYHIVDQGEEEVIGVWGKVDVEVGDKARFIEYEDSTEEKIISVEKWDDGQEITSSYYLDAEEVQRATSVNSTASHVASNNYSSYNNTIRKKSGSKIPLIIVGAWIVFCVLSPVLFSGSSSASSSIEEVLNDDSQFTYETSITGNQSEKAKVYRSSTDLDNSVKIILEGIEGETESVQQNTEDGDNSVAILTGNEYCLVYESEDNAVLVQVSSRKYAYTTDERPYHSRIHTHRYFRRFYYTRGYRNDTSNYGDSTTPYSTFNDTTITSNSVDQYNTYSSSIRQSSVNSRTSSGGGLSSGK